MGDLLKTEEAETAIDIVDFDSILRHHWVGSNHDPLEVDLSENHDNLRNHYYICHFDIHLLVYCRSIYQVLQNWIYLQIFSH